MRSRNTIKWTVVPQDTPHIRRNCSKCGQESIFVNTHKFRVNANKKLIDIWLIYQCKECKLRWNLPIYERILSSRIEPSLYHRFTINDESLAFDYGFDKALYKCQKVKIDMSELEYIIHSTSNVFEHQGTFSNAYIEIISQYDLDVKVTHILAKGLNRSVTEVKRYLINGDIEILDNDVNLKTSKKTLQRKINSYIKVFVNICKKESIVLEVDKSY